MTTFPALVSSTRTYSPGEYPITPHPLMSGSEIRVRHSNTVLGVRLRLTFQAATSADVVAVRNHYYGRQGGFLPFAIPVELLSGVTTPADFTPAGHQWVYASRPSVVDVPIAGDTPTNRHDLVVELVTVPPENTIVSGARLRSRVRLLAGSAELGEFFRVFASLSTGAATVIDDVGAPGAFLAATASLDAGEAEVGAAADPSFASVSLLLKFNGTNGSTTFTDLSSYGHTVTANGNAQVSTAQSVFDGASLLCDGTGDFLSIADHEAFNFGTGDFTIETRLRYISATVHDIAAAQGSGGLFAALALSGTSPSPHGYATGRQGVAYDNLSGVLPSPSTWYAVAFCRSGTSLRIFVDGVQYGGTFTDSRSYDLSHGGLRIATSLNGYMDELRITKGVARYTSNYTPATEGFPTS